MVHVIDDYYVDADAYCYTLLKKNSKKDKNGDDTFKSISYHTSFADAVKSLYKRLCREAVHSNDISLPETVKVFKEIDERLENAVRGLE